MRHTRSKQRGAALVIGLILLVVITLLAVVGMNIANTELASATSEQLRLRAFNAAETGLEARLQTLRTDATTSTEPDERDPEGVENSPLNTVTEEAADTFQTVTTYRGEGNMLSRFSAGTFVGFHYSVESTGRSARNAEAVHTQGAFIINGIGENNTPEPIDPDNVPVDSLPVEGLGSISPG
jgi:type IV pilus assembly protein PilX